MRFQSYARKVSVTVKGIGVSNIAFIPRIPQAGGPDVGGARRVDAPRLTISGYQKKVGMGSAADPATPR